MLQECQALAAVTRRTFKGRSACGPKTVAAMRQSISVADSSLFYGVALGPLRRLRVLALSFAGCLVGIGQAGTLAFHNFVGDGLEATGSLVIPSPFAFLTRSVVGVHES